MGVQRPVSRGGVPVYARCTASSCGSLQKKGPKLNQTGCSAAGRLAGGPGQKEGLCYDEAALGEALFRAR